MRWSRALTLQSIKNNGGLETVIVQDKSSIKKIPFDVLNALVGERTQTLIFININKIIFDKLQFLNMPNLQNLRIHVQYNNNSITSLEPLRELHSSQGIHSRNHKPLKEFTLINFKEVVSLEPLREMRPESLTLHYFPKVSSLEPLRDMRPETLNLFYFDKVSSLEPLREMRPEGLGLYKFSKVESLEPLSEMCPKNLDIDNFEQIKELRLVYVNDQVYCSDQMKIEKERFYKKIMKRLITE